MFSSHHKCDAQFSIRANLWPSAFVKENLSCYLKIKVLILRITVVMVVFLLSKLLWTWQVWCSEEATERKAKVLSPAEWAKKKRECRERVRLHKLKKKKSLSVPNIPTSSADEGKVYETPQALRKALSRVKQVLPNSPRKKRAVISKLAKSADGISS